MVSLWGSKNGGEDNNDDGAASTDGENSRQPSRGGERRSHEANERTRLLPPRNDGFLDPDDPAVSSAHSHIALLYIDKVLGVSLQPMERQSSSLLLDSLHHHNLPLVGAPAGIHLRQSANDAFSWLGVLRLLIHNPHYWQSTHRHTVLHGAFQANGDSDSYRLGLPPDRYDHHPCCTKTAGRRRVDRHCISHLGSAYSVV